MPREKTIYKKPKMIHIRLSGDLYQQLKQVRPTWSMRHKQSRAGSLRSCHLVLSGLYPDGWGTSDYTPLNPLSRGDFCQATRWSRRGSDLLN